MNERDLSGLSNEQLHEELDLCDPPEDLWFEIGLRLGVDGVQGIRVGNQQSLAAERLRRYRNLWEGQPEQGAADE